MNPNSGDPSLADEWFWLCGASSGIGYAVAEALAAHGAKLVLMARNEKNLKNAKQNLLSRGAREVETFCGDITSDDSPGKARAFLGKRQLRGLLLNGGGPHGKRPSELVGSDLMEAHRSLLYGPVMLLQGLIPSLKRPSSVVAITSTTVREVNPNLPLSGAYRSALVAILKNFSEEFGPEGIRFNNVAPGYTGTEKLEELASYVASQQGNAMEKVFSDWGKQAALKRIAAPREIGEVCAFLFSDRSSFVTGQTLMVDGGYIRGY